MIKKIFRVFQGYLKIKITGNALARFINQINDMGIIIWDLERISYDHYKACIYINDFNKLRSLLRKRKCQVSIIAKKGFPFFLRKVRKRIFLLMGVVLFLLIFYFGSSFLLFFETNGLDKIDKQEIIDVLRNQGIKRGILKKDIDLASLEQVLLEKLPAISWVNLKWQGTQLFIDIVEKRIVTPPEYGEIAASKDGVITKLIVLKGQSAVSEGDTVVKGQTLIVPSNDEENVRGIVKANVWYEAVGEAFLLKEQILTTGRVKTFWGVKIGSWLGWLSEIDTPYQQYKRKRETKRLFIWRNIALPIELIKEEHIEINLMKEKRSSPLALFYAKEEALTKILKSLADDSLIVDLIYKDNKVEDKNQISVRLLMKVEENIALKEDTSDRN